MKTLVTGASGLLGRSLMACLAGFPGELIGTAHSRITAPLQKLDLTDDEAVRQAFATWSPDLVIHSAAERRPDVVDGDAARAEHLNVGATALLAELTAARGARFIYLSTDYVFDGKSPPYAVDAKPAPLNAYGQMKLAGEDAVRAAYSTKRDGTFAILRIPILYGQVENLAESAVTELAAKLLDGHAFKAEDWAMRYPAHTDDVARAVALIAEQLMQTTPHATGGTYHFPSGEKFTKYGMAVILAKELAIDPRLIQPDPNPPSGAPRPKDCRLDSSRLDSLGFVSRIHFEEGIREVLAQFKATCPSR